MKTVDAFEAKTHFSELLADVAKGASITITRHGTPVAVLAPVDRPRRSVREVLDEIDTFREREKISLGDATIRELIEEGRR